VRQQSNSSFLSSYLQHKNREEITATILIATALILGVFVRLVYLFQDDFPLNDGGLFYTMVRDLQANRFLIPAVTQYNLSDLPFAYPPLAFYLTGLLNSFFGFDLLSLMRWLPLLFNILAIPVFYHFAKLLFKEPIRAGLATLFFALLKPGYEWLIMGGGLTRSPALFFSLLTLDRYLVLIQSDDKRTRRIIAVILFYSLTFLFHMEIGWFTTYSLALLWFFKGRSWKNFISSAIIAVGAFIATSPYWIQVIRHHSLQPFLAGLFSSGYSPFLSVFELFYFNFTEELIFPILAIIALIGLVIALIRREFLFPAWLVLNAILDARSVNRSDVIPAAMLISIGIVDGVFLLIRKYGSGNKVNSDGSEPGGGLFTRSGILIIYVLCAQVVLTAYLARYTDEALTHVLSKGNRQAMTWIKQNTPPDAQFISLPSSSWWETDTVGEWFPALTERNNALTVQGSEWKPNYQQKIADYKELNSTIKSGRITANDLLEKYPNVNYIYVPLSFFRDSAELAILRISLEAFPLFYSNKDVEVYSVRGN
jgi:hypothetical protein